MRVKTSVSLSQEVLDALDAIDSESRSRAIEHAVMEFVRHHRRALRDARDIEIINREADSLNEEALDVLQYQANPD